MSRNARVALVTGGARRIGAAILERLAREGYDCAIHCNGSRAEAENLADQIAGLGVRTCVLAADLLDPVSVHALVPAAHEALGPVALLVNNASVFEPDTLHSMGPDSFARHISVNLRAPVFLAQAFASQAPPGSSIVNVIDQRVLRLTPQCFSYTLAKSALHAATITMAQTLAPRIRVNAVGPGPTLPNRHDGEEGLRREAQGIPLGRTIMPEEIADAVAWLANAAGVTGQMIAVDGGQHIGWRTPDILMA